MWGLNQNDDNDDAFRRGWGVCDLEYYIMTQHDKVSFAMIYHILLILCFLAVILLASTNLSIIAPFIAGFSLSASWAVADSMLSLSVGQTGNSEGGRGVQYTLETKY